MELKELKEKTVEELQTLLKIWREQSRDLRFSVSSKQLKNIRESRNAKKTVAQILTLIKEVVGIFPGPLARWLEGV